VQERRFAGTVGADNGDFMTLFHGNVYPAQRGKLPQIRIINVS
jgi:hypothetical protein